MKKIDLIPYDFTTQTVQTSNWYDVNDYCNGFTVTNIGDTTVTVNQQILYPGTPGTSLGDSVSWGGNQGEIYKGQLKVSFDAVAPGTNPLLLIIQKVYIIENK